MTSRLLRAALACLLLATASPVCFADSRVHFEVERFPFTDFENSGRCIVTVFAVTGDHDWEVSSLNLGVEYNGAALGAPELLDVNRDVLDDSYAVTVTPNTDDWFRINVLKFVGPRVTIPAGGRIRLFRVRLTVLATNPAALQDVMLENDDINFKPGDILSQVFHGDMQLNYGANDHLGWTAEAGGTQIIAACNNGFYRFVSCDTVVEYFTAFPLSDAAAGWYPEPTSSGFAVVRYQYDFAADLPEGPDEAFEFAPDELEAIGDNCRCAWSAQTGERLPWAETQGGGRMYFSRLEAEIGDQLQVQTLAANTFLASVDAPPDEAFQRIVDTSTCGPASQASRIVFNNTDAFHDANPFVRWTTCAPHGDGPFGCDEPAGITLLDVRSVWHHELGHYLGLTHSVHPDDLMHGWGSRTNHVQVKFTQCDADRVRRLYSPNIIGQPPVNFGAARGKHHDVVLMEGCGIVGVEESDADREQLTEGNELVVRPSPAAPGDIVHIGFGVEHAGHVRLSLHDLVGRELARPVDGLREAGRYSEVIFARNAGAILVRLVRPTGVVVRKMLITR